MSNVYWEMAGHSLALTGDGYLSPDEYDVEFDIRCTECTDSGTGKILIFYSEECVDALHPPHVPHDEVLRAVARHLEPDLTAPMPTEVVESAISLAGLRDDISLGLDLYQEHVDGRLQLQS